MLTHLKNTRGPLGQKRPLGSMTGAVGGGMLINSNYSNNQMVLYPFPQEHSISFIDLSLVFCFRSRISANIFWRTTLNKQFLLTL